MLGFRRHRSAASLGLVLVLLAGCSAPRPSLIDPNLPAHMQFGRDARGKIVTAYKVGKPYQVAGVWYYPLEDYGYREEGIASWYGPGFHGKRTANGEVYDMNALTAAHKTLPMPSIVKVTNLENGRALKLRINDRGPFVDGRIIDLSRRAAQLLDVEKQGTARVLVEFVSDDSRTLKNIALDGRAPPAGEPGVIAAPRVRVVAENLAPPVAISVPLPGPPSVAVAVSTPSLPTPPLPSRVAPKSVTPVTPAAPAVATPSVAIPSGLYIQAGAFTDINNARRLEAQLSELGTVFVAIAEISGRVFHRVRLGPIPDRAVAQEMVTQMLTQGYEGARIVEE